MIIVLELFKANETKLHGAIGFRGNGVPFMRHVDPAVYGPLLSTPIAGVDSSDPMAFLTALKAQIETADLVVKGPRNKG